MGTRWLTVPVAMMACLTAEAADPDSTLYAVSAHVVIATGHVQLGDPEDRDFVLRVGERTIEIVGGDILWDGSPTGPVVSDEMHLVSSPRVITREGEDVVLRSGWSGRIQYFEPGDHDCYRLKTLAPDEGPGLRLDVQVGNRRDLEDGRVAIDLPFGIRVTVLGPRQPIPGVSMDVGPPTLHSTETESTLRLVLGEWDVLMVTTAPVRGQQRSDSLIVFVRVDEMPDLPASRGSE